jgi:hypothetical protein
VSWSRWFARTAGPPPSRWDGVQEVAKATFPAGEIYGNTRYPGLRLITCGGPFDTATRQYLDNIVVYTQLVG